MLGSPTLLHLYSGKIYINKINSDHLDLKVPRQLETNLFGHKLLIFNNEFCEKKVQKNPKEKIFMSSQTFFNLTNKIKIIPVINYFRKKELKCFFSSEKGEK